MYSVTFIDHVGVTQIHYVMNMSYLRHEFLLIIVFTIFQKNNFPVFERNWTALEEMQLLKAVSDCGYGNW